MRYVREEDKEGDEEGACGRGRRGGVGDVRGARRRSVVLGSSSAFKARGALMALDLSRSAEFVTNSEKKMSIKLLLR